MAGGDGGAVVELAWLPVMIALRECLPENSDPVNALLEWDPRGVMMPLDYG